MLKWKCRKDSVSLILCVSIIFVLSGCGKISNSSKYEDALSLMQNGNYEKAADILSALGEYEDAPLALEAITCIEAANEITNELWEKEEEEKAAGGAIGEAFLTIFGLDLDFETEYDVLSYTYYYRVFLPSLLDAAYGAATAIDAPQNLDSIVQLRDLYQRFYDRGFKHITIVVEGYRKDGTLFHSQSYSYAEFLADKENENILSTGPDSAESPLLEEKSTPESGQIVEPASDWSGETIRFDTEFYSLELPEYWADLCGYSQWDIEPYSYGITFYENQSYDDFDGEGGELFSLALYQGDEYYDFPEYSYLGEISIIRLATYDIIVTYPTDVQFSTAGQANYMKLSDDIPDILASFTPQPDLECEYIPATN